MAIPIRIAWSLREQEDEFITLPDRDAHSADWHDISFDEYEGDVSSYLDVATPFKAQRLKLQVISLIPQPVEG